MSLVRVEVGRNSKVVVKKGNNEVVVVEISELNLAIITIGKQLTDIRGSL